MVYESTQVRAFIAIPVPPHAREVLDVVAKRFSSELPDAVRELWKPEQAGFHITLRFLGDSTPKQLKTLCTIDVLAQ